MAITKASQARIETFVDWFIRSGWVDAEWNAVSSDRYIMDPDRAERCDDAAENGSDGSTHAEVINDWRNAFKMYMQERNSWHTYDRFESAVTAHFDSVEAWHEQNDSLHQEIG